MNSVFFSPALDSQSAQRAKSIALIGAVASIVTAGFYLYLANQIGAWQIYAMSVDVWVLAVLLLLSRLLIQRGRTQFGVWLILASAYASFAVGPFLLSGWGLILGLGLAILVVLVATQTLSGVEGERAILLGVIFGIFIILADLFGRYTRMAAPPVMMIGLSMVVVVSALIFGLNFVRQFQQIRIASRLTALIFMTTFPVVIAIAILVVSGAQSVIEAQANENLHQHDDGVKNNLTTWLDLHSNALKELATLPDITSMDPVRQKPNLQAMANAFPNLFLVQTTDVNGINVARNDNSQPQDYHDRQWFLGAKSGAPITMQVLISRTNGKPSLNMSTPIKNASGQIVGVASIVSTLDQISTAVDTVKLGQTGYIFIVDNKNQVVAHPDPSFTSGQNLHDFSNYPPVVALRRGSTGIISFADENGKQWRAYVYSLDNGWGVVAQEPEEELLAPERLFQQVSTVIGIAGLALLWIVSWFSLHRTLQPINELTENVEAISAGNLAITVDVTSQDEIGVLARAFNKMTSQLRDLISDLEHRVSERTKEVERRAVQLRAAAEIGNAAASIRDLDTLLDQTVRLLSMRFGFYHAGIFLLDETRKYAVLRASNSDGGQIMLQHGHKLEVGRVGIVGYVAETGQPRIALDVGKDAVFFDNPDLPDTRSEMALPLQIAGRILGALDIQSAEPHAFSQEDIETLQIVADQLAIAIDNSRLLAESQAAIEATRRAYGEVSIEAWKRLLETGKNRGFVSSGRETHPLVSANEDASAESLEAAYQNHPVMSADQVKLYSPIVLRGQSIGILRLIKPNQERWTDNEIQVVQALSDQLSGALESARLYDEAQRQAAKEQAIGEITSKISASINMRNVLQTAAEELGRAIPGSDIVIQFQTNDEHRKESTS